MDAPGRYSSPNTIKDKILSRIWEMLTSHTLYTGKALLLLEAESSQMGVIEQKCTAKMKPVS